MSPPWGNVPRRDYNLPFDNDCDATASYVFGILLGGFPEPPFRDVAKFFNAMFPGRSLSNDTILEYHDYVWDSPFYLYNYVDGLTPCRPQLCKVTSEHVENAGIGIGTLVSLGLEAVLVLAYCIMAIVLYTRTVPEESRIPQVSRFTVFDRIVYAFYGTTRHFFICAIILCIGTSIGLIADAAHNAMSQSHTYVRPYGHQLLAVAISYFSLAATVPAYLWGSRRQWLDAPLVVLAWLLQATAVILNTIGSPGTYQESFSQICPDDYIPSGVLMGSLFVTHGVGAWCPVLFALTTGCVLPFFRCGGRKMWAKPLVNRAMRVLILLYAVISFLATWAFLIILYIFISKTSWIGSNGFDMGQGLVLALWVPLIYELVHSMVVGIDRGLTAGLPREYVAIREDDLSDDTEPGFVPGMAPGPRGGLRAPPDPAGGYYSAQLSPGTAVGMTPQILQQAAPQPPPQVMVPARAEGAFGVAPGTPAAQLQEASNSKLSYRFA